MIKITIDEDKVSEKKKQYLDAVKDEVVKRIETLLISLKHLNKKKIDLDEGDIRSFKVTTRNTIDIIEEDNSEIKEAQYQKTEYEGTIKAYLTASTNLSKINIVGIINLLDTLIEKDGEKLEVLLTCPADGLSTVNTLLLSGVNTNPGKELDIIKLAFNYDRYANISVPIKKFFNQSKLISYCPYCNLEDVKVIPIDEKNNATGHHLDHFFSQKDFPLLSYSLFNLVPSGYTCNVLNKGQIPFTDDLHMNPHLSGFGDNIRFVPIKTGIEVTGVDIKFNCDPGSKKIKQLIGDLTDIDERHDKGNINVFKLKSKYSDQEHVDLANSILERIHTTHVTQRSIAKFIKMMKNADKEAIHLKWYKTYICTHFYSEGFGSAKDAKFRRDIHDYYFETNKSIINKFFQYVNPFLKKY